MKWVKVAIGAVIAIAVVPMIALSVFNLTQEQTKEEVVTFEILTSNTVTSGTFNLVDSVSLLDEYGGIINFKSLKVNNTVTTVDISIVNDIINIFDNSTGDPILINNDDTYIDDGFSVTIGDIFEITLEVTTPPVLNGVTATLLLLAPLIFVSGILYFIYNNKQEGI